MFPFESHIEGDSNGDWATSIKYGSTKLIRCSFRRAMLSFRCTGTDYTLLMTVS